MGDALSQSDLDALFGDTAPQKEQESTLSQSDLDALFGDMAPAKGERTEDADVCRRSSRLDLSQSGQEPNRRCRFRTSSEGGDLSQDDIDALLKEFLG